MTTAEAQKLKRGQRVKWESSDDKGTVRHVSKETVTIQWDGDDDYEDYPIYEQWHGIAHIVALNHAKREEG